MKVNDTADHTNLCEEISLRSAQFPHHVLLMNIMTNSFPRESVTRMTRGIQPQPLTRYGPRLNTLARYFSTLAYSYQPVTSYNNLVNTTVKILILCRLIEPGLASLSPIFAYTRHGDHPYQTDGCTNKMTTLHCMDRQRT